MVVSAKDTQSAGVGLAHAAQLGIPNSHWATASVGSSRRPCTTANNWPAFTLAPKALGGSCRAFTRRFAMPAVYREVFARSRLAPYVFRRPQSRAGSLALDQRDFWRGAVWSARISSDGPQSARQAWSKLCWRASMKCGSIAALNRGRPCAWSPWSLAQFTGRQRRGGPSLPRRDACKLN